MPKRIQRKRTRGWKMPSNCIYVGRPTVFGNPFPWQKAREAGYLGTEEELKRFSLQVFREWLTDNAAYGHGQEELRQKLRFRLAALRGKDLACWCPLPAQGEPDLCHAAILLEIANR